MSHTTVTLQVQLPAELAEEARRLQLDEPEILGRVIRYALVRRAMFGYLSGKGRSAEAPAPGERSARDRTGVPA